MMQLDFGAQLAVALQDKLSPEEVARAISGGLNRAATGIRAQMVRDLREEVNLKASYLRDILPIQRSTADTLLAEITIRKKDIPLIEYATNLSQLRAGARETKDGRRSLVPPQIKFTKGGDTVVYEHAFYVGKWGKRGVDGGIVERVGRDRLPIRGLYGPSLADHGSRALEAASNEMQERVRKEVTAAIRGQIARAFPK